MRTVTSSALMRQLVKFALVGGVGFVVDVALFTTLRVTVLAPERLHEGPLIAKVLSTLVAIAANWFGNRYWTFGPRPTQPRRPAVCELTARGGAAEVGPALPCPALHCTALHCTALHCTALHCTRHPAPGTRHPAPGTCPRPGTLPDYGALPQLRMCLHDYGEVGPERGVSHRISVVGGEFRSWGGNSVVEEELRSWGEGNSVVGRGRANSDAEASESGNALRGRVARIS